ncbi:MAG: NAD(P)/FAD-dependent oxidoreductase, partial [Blastocatellia bacterium]
MNTAIKVAIIGGGVAGSVTAMELAKAGASVTVIERDASVRWKIGEGLPPAAKPLLQQLGVWERFLADNHMASYGNCSAWGSSELVDQSFVFNPYGNGWHLDRSRFDQLLLNAAVEAGAKVVSNVEAETVIAAADFVVDASGRTSWFARRQRAQRISVDNLVAVAALLTADGESGDQDSLTMVEAVAEGWWYAALLPCEKGEKDGKLIAVYLSDADLDSARQAGTTEGWLKLLGETQRLQARIERRSYRIELEPRIVSANSSRLDQVFGKKWLAVGDAAAAFDPLSSQGIVTAMEFGILAAQAILAGEPEALIAYSQRLERV